MKLNHTASRPETALKMDLTSRNGRSFQWMPAPGILGDFVALCHRDSELTGGCLHNRSCPFLRRSCGIAPNRGPAYSCWHQTAFPSAAPVRGHLLGNSSKARKGTSRYRSQSCSAAPMCQSSELRDLRLPIPAREKRRGHCQQEKVLPTMCAT